MTSIVLDDCDNSDRVENAVNTLKFVELGVVILFMVEIALRVYAFGFKEHFKDCWYAVDTVIILVTFALVIVDIKLGNDSSWADLSRIRGLFRLVRIFLMMRKLNSQATEISRIARSPKKLGRVDVKSPAEKIMDLLESIKRSTKDKDLIKELNWAIEIISTNKLYDPILEAGGDGQKDKSEASLWLNSCNSAGNNSPVRDAGGRRLSKFALVQTRRASTKNSDKIRSLQRLSSLRTTPDAINIMDKYLDELDFNIFEFRAACNGDELLTLMAHLFEKHSLLDSLGIETDVFNRFILRIQTGYPNNPYHNSTHAADVVQTTNYLIVKGNFIERAELSNLELAAMYLASAVHDYEHPGSNNVFQINTGSDYAIRYNDKSVLENHHIAATFALLKDESLNIFKGFSREDYKLVRERMISMVLATDMSSHFPDIAQFKGRLAADFDMKKDKNFMMNMIVHSSDISNPFKQWDVCKEWTNRIVTEFFSQGDKERALGLPITNLCDRYTVNVAKSQIGFIDFVVAPLMNLMKEVMPGIDISNLESNKEKWKGLIEHYDKELAAQNEKVKAGENNNVQAVREK